MLTTIVKATENFCIHQIRETHCTNEGVSKKRTLIAYIDIDANDGTSHRVYIASDEAFMQRVAYLFLEEQESDEETLVDMTLETTNLIVGSAKVIAEELGENPFTISTPHFIKIGDFDLEHDAAHIISIKDDEITIAIKELHD
ncbi:chemotaxis protein CheX [Sulfurimonas sp. SAG-AH-194-C20]|nr:chemotaxis protein CheX [Sulfurimonas sp. SAG-AH-194-C20]MDF1878666.1 chemotaxis protein CheX [Sulfurimonas sp. SAG-AH-194-C20]